MKKLFVILFYTIFLISLIIALFSKISFYVFIKRTVLYFILIAIGLKSLENVFKAYRQKDSSKIKKEHDSVQDFKEEDFKPLEFNEIVQAADEKSLRIKKNPGGLTGNE